MKEIEDFVVHHLVDPKDWVADHERSLCHVCTRTFGTFRRKHHCRMCGEVVCSNCTLYKNAVLASIGITRVRVCMSCILTQSHHHHHHHHKSSSRPYSPRLTMPESPISTIAGDDSRQWVSAHLHSPLSKSQESNDDNQSSWRSTSSDNQATNDLINANNQDDDQLDYSWEHPWPKPPVRYDEPERLTALHALEVLDSPPEKPFDMICELAKSRLACPMAAVSFMDEHRQWFKASVGLAHKMIPRKIAFCAYTVFHKEPIVVLDTLKDKRFECNPLVSGAAEVRFYAAAPILDPMTGHAIGSVFVLDTRPRESCDITILERLAHAASENLPKESVKQREEETPELEEPMLAPSALVNASSASSSSSSAMASFQSGSNEQMEVLLMRLLTQNTETQQQLANQQLSMNQTLGFHSQQINKLMYDFARMEAKMEAKIKKTTTV